MNATHCTNCRKNVAHGSGTITVGGRSYCSDECMLLGTGQRNTHRKKYRRKEFFKHRLKYIGIFCIGIFMMVMPWIALIHWTEEGGRIKPAQLILLSFFGIGASIVGIGKFLWSFRS